MRLNVLVLASVMRFAGFGWALLAQVLALASLGWVPLFGLSTYICRRWYRPLYSPDINWLWPQQPSGAAVWWCLRPLYAKIRNTLRCTDVPTTDGSRDHGLQTQSRWGGKSFETELSLKDSKSLASTRFLVKYLFEPVMAPKVWALSTWSRSRLLSSYPYNRYQGGEPYSSLSHSCCTL